MLNNQMVRCASICHWFWGPEPVSAASERNLLRRQPPARRPQVMADTVRLMVDDGEWCLMAVDHDRWLWWWMMDAGARFQSETRIRDRKRWNVESKATNGDQRNSISDQRTPKTYTTSINPKQTHPWFPIRGHWLAKTCRFFNGSLI